MKKALAIIVSLVFVLSITGLSFAKEKRHATKAMHVTGEVTAVDAAANTLTIKGKKGEVMLTTTDKTKFAKGKTLADVKVGDKLTRQVLREGRQDDGMESHDEERDEGE